VAAEAAAAQEQQRAGSATRSHERSEFAGIPISFAEPGSAPRRKHIRCIFLIT